MNSKRRPPDERVWWQGEPLPEDIDERLATIDKVLIGLVLAMIAVAAVLLFAVPI